MELDEVLESDIPISNGNEEFKTYEPNNTIEPHMLSDENFHHVFGVVTTNIEELEARSLSMT